MKRYTSIIFLFLCILTAKSQEMVHYIWFDKSTALTSYPGQELKLDINVPDLSEGFHTFNHIAVTASGSMTPPMCSTFLKMTSIGDNELFECFAIVDNNITQKYDCAMHGSLIHFDLDMSSLPEGLHRLTMYMRHKNGINLFEAKSAYFLKLPTNGTEITKVCYWINDNKSEVHAVETDGSSTTCDIVKLLDVGNCPFKSTSFDVQFNEDKSISMFARNQFNFYAVDKSGRFTSTKTATFVDVNSNHQVRYSDIAELLPCEKKYLGGIADNEVKWYRITANEGDSLVFKTDRACTMDLFSADGVRCMTRSGYDAVCPGGCYADKDGDFYLAVHDIAGKSKGSIYLDYSVIDKFAVISHSPTETGISDMVRIDFTGNGFDKLKEVQLIASPQKIITPFKIDSLSRNRMGACFDLSKLENVQSPIDLNLIFNDNGEDFVINLEKALNIADSETGEIKVEVIPSGRAKTPYEVTIRVTNTGSTPYWAIPFTIGLPNTGAGSTLHFLNFFPFVKEEHKDYISVGYFTPNFLNSGNYGWYFPMMITYLGANETKEYKIGIDSKAHQVVSFYAWAGEPWSEAFKRLTNPDLVLDELSKPSLNYMQASDFVRFEACQKIEGLEEWLNEKNKSRSTKKTAFAVPTFNPVTSAFDVATTATEVAFQTKDVVALTGAKVNSGSLNGLWDMPEGQTDEYTCARNVSKIYASQARVRSASDIVMDSATPSWITVSQWIWQFFTGGCQNEEPKPEEHQIEILKSGDPNDISGYVAESGSEYIGLDIPYINYSIDFENDPAIASASACAITVKDHLDPSIFDISTFKPKRISFAGHQVEFDGTANQIITEDMRPEINAIAQIEVSCSPTGDMEWKLSSMDPMTMDPTDLAMQGILPVNTDGSGVGCIDFDIALKTGLSNCCEIANKAIIKFDNNEDIETPTWHNTTDYIRPISMISNITKSSDEELLIYFEGTDNESGIWYYNIYYREDGGEWNKIPTIIKDTSVSFKVDRNKKYEFLSIARDMAGNHEQKDFIPEFTYDLGKISSKDAIEISSDEIKPDTVIYDILGRKVDSSPKPGIYIINNQKVLIK